MPKAYVSLARRVFALCLLNSVMVATGGSAVAEPETQVACANKDFMTFVDALGLDEMVSPEDAQDEPFDLLASDSQDGALDL